MSWYRIMWTAVVIAAIARVARGQPCEPHWAAGFAANGFAGTVAELAAFDDDGDGPHTPALYAAGAFYLAGGLDVSGIALWNGDSWSSVGGGVSGGDSSSPGVFALTLFDDDGDGPHLPALYAGGIFNTAGGVFADSVARWDGSSWSGLGSGMSNSFWPPGVFALCTFDDDGDGPASPALYAGGQFSHADLVAVGNIAKWDGTAWSALGSGIYSAPPVAPFVYALAVFDDDGEGPNPTALYVGGSITTAGGVSASNIAKWTPPNGSGPGYWSAVGGGTDGSVTALVVFDGDGPGADPPALYAGGVFTTAGGVDANHIAKWDGTAWSALAGGTDGYVARLTVFDDDGPGSHGEALYAAGSFTSAGGVSTNHVAMWDGTAWSALGSGTAGLASALLPFDDDGSGPHSSALLVAAGLAFYSASPYQVQKWNAPVGPMPGSWSPLETNNGTTGAVYAMTAFDEDGDGPNRAALYAGGEFLGAGTVPATDIARWDGDSWAALGSGTFGPVYTLIGFDGTGNVPLAGLYVGGAFVTAGEITCNYLAKWDGAAWSPVGGGMSPPFTSVVRALAIYDDDADGPHAPALYAGGRFTAAGGVNASSIARWDGISWAPLGGGLAGSQYGPVARALVAFDDDGDGPGPPALYVGGVFQTAGGVNVNHVARWNGTWSSLGSGVAGGGLYGPAVYSFAIFDDDGDGSHSPALYVGGDFTSAGGVPANRIARWDGTAWSPVGGGLGGTNNYPNPSVFALADYDDDGDGPNPASLYAGGYFTSAGGVDTNNIARWNGEAWASIAGGTSGYDPFVLAFSIFDDDGGGPVLPALYVGGGFTMAGALRSGHIARWGCIVGDADGDGDVDLEDYALLALCLTGPDAGTIGDGCAVFDLEPDDDVDARDVAALQNVFSG